MTNNEELVLRVITAEGWIFQHRIVSRCPLSGAAVTEAIHGLWARGLIREVADRHRAWEAVPEDETPVATMTPAQVENVPEDVPPGPPSFDPLGIVGKVVPVDTSRVGMGDYADGLVGAIVIGPYKYMVHMEMRDGEWVAVVLEQIAGAQANKRGPDPEPPGVE